MQKRRRYATKNVRNSQGRPYSRRCFLQLTVLHHYITFRTLWCVEYAGAWSTTVATLGGHFGHMLFSSATLRSVCLLLRDCIAHIAQPVDRRPKPFIVL